MAEEQFDNPGRASGVLNLNKVTLNPGYALLTPGSIIEQLVKELVPYQRFASIESYLKYLNEKLDSLSNDRKEFIKTNKEHIDLFEEGAYQAVRALTDDRRRLIAKIVFERLSETTRDALDKKRILLLISQLDDEDMVLLAYYVIRNRTNYDDFYAKHTYLLEPLHATSFSNPAVRERAAMRGALERKLERLGLIKETLMSRTSGVPGLADQMVESGREFVISELGRMILHEISVIGDEEYALPNLV
jgi:hypothetical protein